MAWEVVRRKVAAMLILFVYQIKKSIKAPRYLPSKARESAQLISKQNELKSPHGYEYNSEPVFLNVYGAPELIPRNEFRQPM